MSAINPTPAAEPIIEEAKAAASKLSEAKAAVGAVIFGQETVVERALTTVLAGGHGLLVAEPPSQPGDVQLQRSERLAELVVELAGNAGALVLPDCLGPFGQRQRPFLDLAALDCDGSHMGHARD